MRFNKKTYPFLDAWEFALAEGLRGGKDYWYFHKLLSSIIKPELNKIKENICYVSNTFLNDAFDNFEKNMG